jgi:hypothetical protein
MLKKLFYICVSTVLLALASSVQIYAQEAAMMDVEMIDSESDRLREKTMYSPGESTSTRYGSSNSSPKDSLTNSNQASSSKSSTVQAAGHAQQTKVKAEKPSPVKSAAPQQKQAKNDDDSILSFNFLYYIIEKYKLQDIVD